MFGSIHPPQNAALVQEDDRMVVLNSISATPAHQGKSHEEIRLKDVTEGRPGMTTEASAPLTSSSGFGSTPSSSLFGGFAPPASTSGFGSTVPPASSFGFGSTPPAPAPSAFGSTAPASSSFGFVSSAPAPTSGFGSSAPAPTSGFGGNAPASTSGFGSTAPASSSSVFGSTAPASSSSAFGGTAPASTSGFGSSALPSLGFGGSAPAPTPGFGSTAPASTSEFGSSAPAFASGFGSSAPASTSQPVPNPPSTGFAFGTAAPTSQPVPNPSSTGFAFGTAPIGLFGTGAASTASGCNAPPLFGATSSLANEVTFSGNDFLSHFNNSQKSDVLVQISLNGRNRIYSLHRFILSLSSSFFEEAFLEKEEKLILDFDEIFKEFGRGGKETEQEKERKRESENEKEEEGKMEKEMERERKEQQEDELQGIEDFLKLLYGKNLSFPQKLTHHTLQNRKLLSSMLMIYQLSIFFRVQNLREKLETLLCSWAEDFLLLKKEQPITFSSHYPPKASSFVFTSQEDTKRNFNFTEDFVSPLLLGAIKSKDLKIQQVYSRVFSSLDAFMLQNSSFFSRKLSEKEFVEIFSMDSLLIEDDYCVYQLACRWIEEHDCNEATKKNILSVVRFPFVFQENLLKLKQDGILSSSQFLFCLENQVLVREGKKVFPPFEPLEGEKGNEKIGIVMNNFPRILQRRVDLDLVIVCDNTGSMSSEINSMKATVTQIIREISANYRGLVRFGLVTYRDHTDSYVTRNYQFTSSLDVALACVNEMDASGGGDTPEALDEALAEVSSMEFRKDALKYAILIGDAGPHGIGYPSDNYPGGSPNNLDWLELCEELSQKGIVFLTCVSERALSDDRFVLFMDTVAKKTNGKCLRMLDASKLSDVIINGTLEDLDLNNFLIGQISKMGIKDLSVLKDNEQLAKQLKENMDKEKFMTRQLNTHEISHTNAAQLQHQKKQTEETKKLFSFGSSSLQASTASFGAGSSAFGTVSFGTSSFAKVSSALNQQASFGSYSH